MKSITLQRRRQDFFRGGGRPDHLKAITRPPQGVQGARDTYLKIFKFYETYKSRENFGEFSYLVEKFTVAVQGIFSVGTLEPLKDYQAPPAGGPVGEGPPDGGEVSFFKTIQSI